MVDELESFDDVPDTGSGRDPYRGSAMVEIRRTLQTIQSSQKTNGEKLDLTIATDIEQNARLSTIEVSVSKREIDIEKLTRDLDQRQGASKLTAKLIGALGAIVIAGFLGLFGYLWSGNADDTRRDSTIERLAERQVDHAEAPGHRELGGRVSDQERRTDALDGRQKRIRRDVDTHGGELQRLRERPTPRRR